MPAHIAHPVRFVAGRIATVEQDSPAELAQAVRSVLAYRPGQRTDLPAFGTPDAAFAEGGPGIEAIREVLERWEPRALAGVEADLARLAEGVARVRIEIGRR